MTVLHAAQDRISFAAEGLALAAADALDAARDRSTMVLTGLAAVVVALLLLLVAGGSSDATAPSSSASAGAAAAEPTYLSERGFSLSLPAGWDRTQAPDGAAFAASSADGLAETTLWVERDPSLKFGTFVTQSMQSLDEIGAGVRVSDRAGGPRIETRITELRAEVPLDGGLAAPYHVTLRAAGPYRYYLATSVSPGAPTELFGDAELLGASFRPQIEPQAAPAK